MDNKYYKQAYEEGREAFLAEGVEAKNPHITAWLRADFPNGSSEWRLDGWNAGWQAARRDAEGAHEQP